MLTVLTALQGEADVLLPFLHGVREGEAFGKKIYEGSYEGCRCKLILTGVGKSNAAAGAMLALAHGAEVLLNFGTAGGLNGRAPVGSVLQIERAVQFDVDLCAVNGTEPGTLNEYQTPYIPLTAGCAGFVQGTLATGDRFGDGRDRALLQKMGCDAQDMEGAAIAHVAERAKAPLLMFKAVSDNADETGGQDYYQNLRRALGALQLRLNDIFAAAAAVKETR